MTTTTKQASKTHGRGVSRVFHLAKVGLSMSSLCVALFLAGCSLPEIENAVAASQLSTVDSTISGAAGSCEWNVDGKSFTSKGLYRSSTKTLIMHADADNILEFTFSTATPSLKQMSIPLVPVAIYPYNASVLLKRRNTDGSGYLSTGVNVIGSLDIMALTANQLSARISFDASAAAYGTGALSTIHVSGSVTDVPIR